jgi:hypothetical protein
MRLVVGGVLFLAPTLAFLLIMPVTALYWAAFGAIFVGCAASIALTPELDNLET